MFAVLPHFVLVLLPMDIHHVTFKTRKEEKVDFECRVFKAEWSVNYFVTELDDKALCLLHNDTIAVLHCVYCTMTL